MRAFVVALGLGTVLGAAAHAGDLTDPVWAQAPDRGAWAKAYPPEAAQARVSGEVKLKCVATDAGRLRDCAVVSEAPAGQGFAAAALSLTPDMQLKPNGQDGAPVAERAVIVPVKFEPSILQAGAAIVNPDWMRRPTFREMAAYWPAAAHGTSGHVRLECAVTVGGELDSCAVTEETPPHRGFGDAALAMSSLFMMRPMTVDGAPVGGSKVIIPLTFNGPGQESASVVGATRVSENPPWSAAPTRAALAQAFPAAARGKSASAHVILRCRLLTPSERLAYCVTISEVPAREGFAQAAQSLTKDFKASVDPREFRYGMLLVDVPFAFEDPSAARPAPDITPLWLRDMSAADKAALFPAAAAKAGYTSAHAVLACTAAHDGTLTDCAVEQEEPADLGVGQAALKVAAGLAMNPWTAQGAPVEGDRLSVDIRLGAPAAK